MCGTAMILVPPATAMVSPSFLRRKCPQARTWKAPRGCGDLEESFQDLCNHSGTDPPVLQNTLDAVEDVAPGNHGPPASLRRTGSEKSAASARETESSFTTFVNRHRTAKVRSRKHFRHPMPVNGCGAGKSAGGTARKRDRLLSTFGCSKVAAGDTCLRH